MLTLCIIFAIVALSKTIETGSILGGWGALIASGAFLSGAIICLLFWYLSKNKEALEKK
jgi:hypothetical protein